ncbi:hypothetical protein [Enterococcus ureasiticus]|uniref:Uncharacterized protein n=1 Tax=Enterococcus ureasiticus TaxID=903984 RepID=A0A1E5GFN1_9ENTE|nr:hypothetical protein [Enterococcus ureasiticus]OEG11457.1 hypothetical protein BCR21_09175 [Enterococcus ureasiticus]
MKVPWIWKGLGWFLIVVPLIGLVGMFRLVMEFGFSYIFSIIGVLLWISLISVTISVIVGVLLIKGSIWGYHLAKVLMVIAIINIIFLMFDFELKTIVSQIVRIIILCNVIYSNTTNLYLSELRNNKRKVNV